MRAMIAVAGSALLSLSLLVVSGLLHGTYWQLWNAAFFALLLLPMAFGSHQSAGTFAMLGDLFESMFALSMFAFPTVLHRVDQVSSIGLFLCYLSNACAGVTALLVYRITQEQAIW